MFKENTIIEVRRDLKAAVSAYMAKSAHEIPVCISNGNRKIGKVMNFSLAPIITCGKQCKYCQYYCYDVKACKQYPNTVIDARARNTALMRMDRDYLFSAIDAKMSRRKTNKFFRWHVAGDIVDMDYFVRMVDNARRHPDFVIWTYTKQYHIVNEYCEKYGKDSIPSNFTIMFSEWRGLPMVNPFGFPEFRVIFKGEETPKDVTWVCPGNCDICKACHRGCVANETTHAHEH